MSIPLDRLYHYILNVAQEIYNDRIIIYRFYPHGSKNINDLNNLHESEHGVTKQYILNYGAMIKNHWITNFTAKILKFGPETLNGRTC
jgi:hypothetical protein